MKDEPRLKFTLGIHPHVIAKGMATFLFNKLKKQFEEYPQAVGIGEISLDLTSACKCRQTHDAEQCRQGKFGAQRRFLRLALQMAKQLGKVIVLHVRDFGTGEAAKEVLSLLLELGLSNAPIHRPCFIGGEDEYKQWSNSLPNCYFSLSAKSLKDRNTVAWLLLLERPDRLIIETDSPYLANNPWIAYSVAEGAAQRIGIPTIELLRACNRNVARLYSLPW